MATSTLAQRCSVTAHRAARHRLDRSAAPRQQCAVQRGICAAAGATSSRTILVCALAQSARAAAKLCACAAQPGQSLQSGKPIRSNRAPFCISVLASCLCGECKRCLSQCEMCRQAGIDVHSDVFEGAVDWCLLANTAQCCVQSQFRLASRENVNENVYTRVKDL